MGVQTIFLYDVFKWGEREKFIRCPEKKSETDSVRERDRQKKHSERDRRIEEKNKELRRKKKKKVSLTAHTYN